MPRSRSRARAQTSLYETDLTEQKPELEKALKTRESMQDALSTAKHNFKIADDAVQPKIAELELGHDTAVRVGRFVITSKARQGHTVQSFDVAPRDQIRIKLLDEE